MNCILLSGGLFQIYSNIVEDYLSYEDLTNKILNKYPNIKNILDKYKNIKKLESKSIEAINEAFIKELNIDSQKQISNNLFEGQKENFETIDLKQLYLFFDKFNKIYFNYDNLLYLLIDFNIFKLLDIKITNITLHLNINDMFNNKEINTKKYIVFDNVLDNLYYYHSLGCFTVYLTHLVKIDLKTDKQMQYIDSFNDKNLVTLNDKGIFFDFSLIFMIQCVNYIKYIEKYDEE